MMRRALLTFALVGLGCSCGSKCPDPTYEGKATDEAYLSMIDGEGRATTDPDKAPTLQVTDGMVFPGSPVPTFRWTSTLSASAAPRPNTPRRALPVPSWFDGLVISKAWAHLPPITGSVFWLKIAVPGEACPVEVLTTQTVWTPSANVWAAVKKGTGPRSITGYSAYLTENRITEGEYKTPMAVTFTVSL